MTLKHNTIILSSTEEIALSKLPKREEIQCTHISADVHVRKARKNLQRVKPRYGQKLIRSAFKDTTKTQWILDEAPASVDAEYIEGEIDKIVR